MFKNWDWITYFLTWRDFIDFLLLTVLFYVFYLTVLNFRGFKILLWFFYFIFLWAVANLLQLKALGWLLNQFWSIFLFAIIVIFQPELRRLFQSFGGGGFFFQRFSRFRAIKHIIRAVFYMAEKQIGALIVIERNVPVLPLSEGCVRIDGFVSSELLVTIFYPLTPLHDGAVVIRGNRIIAASCVLPLAQGIELDTKYGTRHRAAIGITQQTDAIAVVVSEETGKVSVAIGGKLFGSLNEDELKDLLLKELGLRKEH